MRFRTNFLQFNLLLLFSLVTIQQTISTSNASHIRQIPLVGTLKKDDYSRCTYYTCFHPHLCAFDFGNSVPNQIRVFVLPSYIFSGENNSSFAYVDSDLSRKVSRAVGDSKYAVLDPSKACLFISSLDFEGVNHIPDTVLPQMLQSFPWLENEMNHMIFASNILTVLSDRQIGLDLFPGFFAGGGLSIDLYRQTFDISLPVSDYKPPTLDNSRDRRYILTFNQDSLSPSINRKIELLLMMPRKFPAFLPTSVAMVKNCTDSNCDVLYYSNEFDIASQSRVPFSELYSSSVFCIVGQWTKSGLDLVDFMKSGCIPILIDDSTVLPFSEKFDWVKCSLNIPATGLDQLFTLFASLSANELFYLHSHLKHFFNKYVSSVDKVVSTALDIANDRVFPYYSKSWSEWNEVTYDQMALNSRSRLSADSHSICNGFTIVLFCQQHSLLLAPLLRHLDSTARLREIFIVWTSTTTEPPPNTYLPVLKSPVRVLRSLYNEQFRSVSKLPDTDSYAFFVLDEHEYLPSVSDLNFAYEVWCQNPSDVVGFHNISQPLSDPNVLQRPNKINEGFSGPVFFHKYYMSLYLEGLGSRFNFLLSSPNCVELMLIFMVERLSEKPRLRTVRRYNSAFCGHFFKSGSPTSTESYLEGSDLVNRSVFHERLLERRSSCVGLLHENGFYELRRSPSSLHFLAQPYRRQWNYPKRG